MSECYGSTAENKETNLQHMESGKHCTYQRVDLKTHPRLLVSNRAENTGCRHDEGEYLSTDVVLHNVSCVECSCSFKVSEKCHLFTVRIYMLKENKMVSE